MAGMKLYYEATGIWSAVKDINTGDPLAAGSGASFNMAGYTLTDVIYENVDDAHHVLSLGEGHKALLLDDTSSGAKLRLYGGSMTPTSTRSPATLAAPTPSSRPTSAPAPASSSPISRGAA